MPGSYVFPGGQVHASDRRPWHGEAGSLGGPDQQQLRSLARAALRETFEETGLLLGRPRTENGAVPGGASAIERALEALGLVPALEALSPIGRAITPAHSRIRFHARFFVADGALAAGAVKPSEELEDVHWHGLNRGIPEPMSDVTQFMLHHAITVSSGNGPRGMPLYRYIAHVPKISWSEPR
jgi:8-oxo-dGTP pyrophosphatase MutT (NUDIX family)